MCFFSLYYSPTTTTTIITAKLGACVYDNVVGYRRGFPAGGSVSHTPQLASRLESSTLHHALSGMEEKDKKEHVCIYRLYRHALQRFCKNLDFILKYLLSACLA